MKKTVFAIRTHQFGDREKSLYDYAVKYFGENNTLIACNNNSENIKIPIEYNHFFFNQNEILNESGLFFHPNWGWRCGDYWYYALQKILTGIEYVWLCEPDVYFCNKNAEDFFKPFEKLDCDFLTKGLCAANANMYFFNTSKVLDGKPMSCIFPITRIKTSLINVLLEERTRLSETFINQKNHQNLYPNDEIFVCTTLNRMNYSIKNMDFFTYFDFRLFTANKNQAMTIDDASEIKGDLIIHPVLEKKIFINKKVNFFNEKLKNNLPISDWIMNMLLKTKDQNLKKELISEFERTFSNFIKRI